MFATVSDYHPSLIFADKVIAGPYEAPSSRFPASTTNIRHVMDRLVFDSGFTQAGFSLVRKYQAREEVTDSDKHLILGARKLTGENLKLVWAEFSI